MKISKTKMERPVNESLDPMVNCSRPGISHIRRFWYKAMYRIILGISPEYPISHKNRKNVCTGNFLGYPWNIPYPKKTEKTYVPTIFWDIPGISHIPKIDKVGMYRFYFGINPYPIFFLIYVPRVRKI